jgi:hypothetical protein
MASIVMPWPMATRCEGASLAYSDPRRAEPRSSSARMAPMQPDATQLAWDAL